MKGKHQILIMNYLSHKMKKSILVPLIVIVLLISLYVFVSEPSVTGAAVGVANEKIIYLDNVKNIVERAEVILTDANKSTELKLSFEITKNEYKENIENNLEEIQKLKSQLNSLNVPSSYKNHHESLKKEMDYYEFILRQMLNNIK